MRPRFPNLPPGAALLLAACVSDPYAPPDPLRPADVAGTYLVCELRFVPTHRTLPGADVLAAVMVAEPPGQPPPSLALSGTDPEFELAYVRRRDGAVQRLRGDVEFGNHSVFIYPTSQLPSSLPLELLLPPAHLDLVFHAAARRLTAGEEVSAYTVRRQDYAAAAGISAEGLQERIPGHVVARFAEGACGG